MERSMYAMSHARWCVFVADMRDAVLHAICQIDLRVYLIITLTSPMLAFYHEGFVRRATRAYVEMDEPEQEQDEEELEQQRQAHLTNTAIAKKQVRPYGRMSDRL